MEATLSAGSAVRPAGQRFHLWMALMFIVVAFGGCVPTYWAPVASGTFPAPPAAHVHGCMLFAWTAF